MCKICDEIKAEANGFDVHSKPRVFGAAEKAEIIAEIGRAARRLGFNLEVKADRQKEAPADKPELSPGDFIDISLAAQLCADIEAAPLIKTALKMSNSATKGGDKFAKLLLAYTAKRLADASVAIK